jgi:integrase
LKKVFEGVRQVIPIYTSPFEVMCGKLHAKLNKTRKGNATKKALTTAEVKALLDFLRLDITVTGRENYAIAYMLATSGLRASELCQLKWGDLDFASGKWTTRFIGKGAKDAEQELFPAAVEACRQYFGCHFRRAPRSEDALFYTVPTFLHQEPMTPHTLWTRVKSIGAAVVEAGVITREL